MAQKMEMALFQSVEGSMVSDDGKLFMLQVKRPTGGDLLLGFPHTEISHIVEHAAVQMSRGSDAEGRRTHPSFTATLFRVGKAPGGEPVLTLFAGKAGLITFVLPNDMPGPLSQALQKLAN